MAALNLNEAYQKIKRAGAAKVRSVPMAGQNCQDGFYKIEVLDGGTWSPIVENLTRRAAEDMISQAVNRMLCG